MTGLSRTTLAQTSMSSTNTSSIPHRSWCRIIKSGLSIASNRVVSNKYASTQSSQAWLPLCCIVGETFESKALVTVFKAKPVLWREQLRSIHGPNNFIAFSTGNLSNLCSSNMGTTQNATKNCGLPGLFNCISESGRNSLCVLFEPKFSPYPAAFNVRTPSQTWQ